MSGSACSEWWMREPYLNASRRIGQRGMLDHDTRAKCVDEIYIM